MNLIYLEKFCKKNKYFWKLLSFLCFTLFHHSVCERTMDAETKGWSKSCDAAKQLRQDIVDGVINVKSYKASNVQAMRPVYAPYPKTRFSSNLRNIVTEYNLVSQLGEDAVQQWLPEGKIPEGYNEGKNMSILI